MSMSRCTHLDQVEILQVPESIAGCEECLVEGTQWVHLRMCQTCGHIGCCDNSPGRHATLHHGTTGHPIIRSAEPNEDWSFCYEDDLMFILRSS
jgi:Zn-finger in ubiquitin-hydrolases and other protein